MRFKDYKTASMWELDSEHQNISMIVALTVAAAILTSAPSLKAQAPFDAVAPLIGTANDGQTAPMVGMPFALTNWTPETRSTEQKCVAPYYFGDPTIAGFRGSHWLSGSCAQEYGSFSVMPVTGPIDVTPAGRASNFRRETEKIDPAYYSVYLDRYSEKVEMTGATRSGVLRVTFPATRSGSVLIEPNSGFQDGFIAIHERQREIVGYNPVHRIYLATGQLAGFSGYFVARFSAPMISHGTWCGVQIHERSVHQGKGCKRLGAYASFAPSAAPLLIKIGTSFTSLEEAARNLDSEQKGWDFDGVRRATQSAWETRLNRIEIEGATRDQRQIFYTALYHASLQPRIANDFDGTYNGFAHKGHLHKIDHGDYYDDYSMWDTFRALHPLLTIIDPVREQQIVESLVLKGQQGGYLPTFPLFNSYTAAMVGDHTGALIADAYSKGLRGFDVKEAYRLMVQNATLCPPVDKYRAGMGRRGISSYLQFGYIPVEDLVPDAFHHREQVSRTLEYAYDDAMVGILAKDLGTATDVDLMAKHSENWRNVFNPDTKFVQGRHSDGSWVEPFDAGKAADYVTEANPWQYSFFVPQNIPGLIQAMGGTTDFVAKLDGLFEKRLYDHGNEPSHHIAYLYDYAGAAWKTQHQVRRLLLSQYGVGPKGLPGNDDAGQMSAWYIFSAMGFYPVTPGTPSYAVGSPLFKKVTIHQPNGNDFVITAKGQTTANEYIQSQELNQVPMNGFLLPHTAIERGGSLSFVMGPSPLTKFDGMN